MNLEPETQSQRWVKYGANVALSSTVVILLAVGVVYLSQRRAARIDTTIGGVNSLRPQTVAVLKELKVKTRIVSLYPRAGEKGEQDYYQPVADLLEEYARKSGGGITVDLIDPVNEPSKLDSLIKEVTDKYGSEVKPYKEFLDEFPKFVEAFKAFADEQAKGVTALPVDKVEDAELGQTLLTAQATLTSVPDRLKQASDKIERRLKGNIPNYRGAVDDCQFELQLLDQLLSRVVEDFKALPAPPRTPEAVKGYATASLPAFESAQKLVKEQLDKARALGDLKLDALRDSIKRKTVLVMGEKDMKVLGFGDVWQTPDDLRSFVASGSDKPRRKFAGEQQISTALVALSRPTKPRVIFVRPGGQPLAQAVFRQAAFSSVARRLREANFEVLEKDLSGQFAQQAQMQGFPVSEATDEQMRDRSAIWVAFSLAPAMSQMGPNPLPGKLKEHLAEGGSALVLVEPGRDDCSAATGDFGVRSRTDAIVVKASPAAMAGAESGDMIANAKRIPYIFPMRRYGNHALTNPIASLEGLLLPLTPVEITSTSGVTATPLLPITRDLQTWGETDVDGVLAGESKSPVFDAAKDIGNTETAPLFAGAAVEKGAMRLVVLGTATSFSNNLLNIPDPELEKQGYLTPRFPGNAELFVNSVLWLGKMETLLAISPSAMDVSRIGDIPEAQLAVVRWGVILAGLPLLVLFAGTIVYLRRRD